MSMQEQLDKINQDRQNPLPTPPRGTPINWFDANDDDRVYAAIVTNIEGPGKLEIVIFKPRHHAMHKQGVLHRSHPLHRSKHNTITIGNGAWDYLPGSNIPKAHRELHLKELERLEENLLESQRRSEQIKAAQEAAAK